MPEENPRLGVILKDIRASLCRFVRISGQRVLSRSQFEALLAEGSEVMCSVYNGRSVMDDRWHSPCDHEYDSPACESCPRYKEAVTRTEDLLRGRVLNVHSSDERITTFGGGGPRPSVLVS